MAEREQEAKVTLIAVDDGIGFVMPAEIVAHFRLQVGDELKVERAPAGINIKVDEFKWQLAVAHEIMERDRAMLRQLARS